MYLVSVFEADPGQAQVQPPLLQTPSFYSLVRPAEVKLHDDPVVIAKGSSHVPIQNYQTLNSAPAGPGVIQGLPLPALAEVLGNCASFTQAPNYIQQQVQPWINQTSPYEYQSGPVQQNHEATFGPVFMGHSQIPATQIYPIMANQEPMDWASPDMSHHMDPTPKNLMWHSLPQAQYHLPYMEPSRNVCSSPGGMTMSSFGGSMSSLTTAYPNYSSNSSQQFSGPMSHSSISSWETIDSPNIRKKSKCPKKLVKSKQNETMWKEKLIFCKLCKSNQETRATYESHVTVDENGITRCPVLRVLVCPLCGASGDFAHTMKYCPKVLEKKQIEADENQEKEEEQEESSEKLPVIMEEFQDKEHPQNVTSVKGNLGGIRGTAGGYFLAKY